MTRRNLLLGTAGIAGTVTASALVYQEVASPPGRRLRKDPIQPPRNDKWRVIGPGGGGALFRPAISPHDDKLILVTCDMGGTYISEDGGSLWRQICLRDSARFIHFDPYDPAVIYLGVKPFVYRSADKGKSWSLFLPNPAGLQYRLVDDESNLAVTTRPEIGSVYALAVDPADSRQIYFSTGRTIYFSKDGGRRYVPIAQLESKDCLQLAIDPQSPPGRRTVYAIGSNWAAMWHGGKWTGGGEAAPRVFRDTTVCFPQDRAPVIYSISAFEPSAAGFAGGILVSDSGGASWQPLHEGFLRLADAGSKPPLIRALAAPPSDPSILYLSYGDLIVRGEPWQGVARSSDGGKSWELVLKESRQFAVNLDEGWFPDRFRPDWPESPLGLAVGPNNPNLCVATDLGRAIRTGDGGRTWQQIYTQSLEDGTYTSTGLDVTTTYGVHFDPLERRRVFITFTDIGLFRSENRGRSWKPSNFGCPREWQNTTYWLEFDPSVPDLMWAVMSGAHDLPRRKMCCETAAYKGGVCVSRDGGRTWSASNAGMPAMAATHILLDPSSPAHARVLYVTGYGAGVFKSVDNGATWTPKNAGIEPLNRMAWRMARARNGTLYLVVARQKPRAPGGPGDGAVYQSADGAETWKRLHLPAAVNGPNGIAVDPEDPRRLYLACWGRFGQETGGVVVDGGILLSDDGGETWRRVFAGDQHVSDITVDPQDPRVVYAAGFESAIWRSADRAQTWKRIPGFNFNAAQRVIPDPNAAGMIYVTTYGSGVWYGPAAGDPSALEDIVTREVAYRR